MPITLGAHATALDRNQVVCSCPELGCNQKTVQYKGKTYQGQKFSRQSYPRHLQQTPQMPPAPVAAATNPAPAVVEPTASTSYEIQAPRLAYVSAMSCSTIYQINQPLT
jgi:hypothetical protein